MKQVYASLLIMGHVISGYIDDSIPLGDSYNECEENISDTVGLMRMWDSLFTRLSPF